MLIEINAADPQVRGQLDRDFVAQQIQAELDHYASRITRVSVYVADQNAGKEGVDKHCSIEIRIGGLKPIAVTAEAESVDEAVTAASGKARRLIETELGRLGTRNV
jgi:hypothetical protein